MPFNCHLNTTVVALKDPEVYERKSVGQTASKRDKDTLDRSGCCQESSR